MISEIDGTVKYGGVVTRQMMRWGRMLGTPPLLLGITNEGGRFPSARLVVRWTSSPALTHSPVQAMREASMKFAVVASLLSCALVSSTAAQTKPDLSGRWRLDPTRSESATYPELSRPVTMIITQTAIEVRIDTTRGSGTTSEVAKFGGSEPPTAPGAATARWRGDTLLVDVIRDIRGQSVTVHQEMTLSADGSELVVQSTVNVQHGYSLSGAKVYGAGKDTFTRAR